MTAWTPVNLLTLAGWWDASDTGTVTDDGTGHCSQWNDKSSNANHVTPQSSGKPTITAGGINSLQVLTFGTNTGLQKLAASSLPSATTGIGFGAIVAPTGLSTTACISLGDHTNSTLESMLFEFATTVLHVRTGNINASWATATYSDVTNPHLFSGTCSATLRDVYLDGTAGTSQGTTETAHPSPDICFGRQLAAATNGTPGKYAEIVLFSGASSADRQNAEGYLAWKWGLQANLPGGHPYAPQAPQIPSAKRSWAQIIGY
jgi:hypothetical protein